MRRAILLLFLAFPVFAQTARFPTAVATDADLTVQKDKAQSTITGAMNASQTTVTVVTGSKFIAGMIVSIDNEQALVCSVVGTTVSFGYASCPNIDGRGYASTVAASHVNGSLISGNIVAWNHNSVAAEVKAIETALGVNLGNIPAPTLGSLGAAARGANSDITSLSALSTPLSVPQGGTGAATLTGIVQGNGASAQTATAAASEGQYLRRKLNAGATPVYEFAASPALVSGDYSFAAQAPGGSLSVGSNTITLSPVPLGVNGADVGHYLYISGGTGTAESVLITGGTAVAGAASGTVIVTCANTHSGAWTVQSATGGIQEALNSLPALGGTVQVSDGLTTLQSRVTINGSGSIPHIAIEGAGTVLQRGAAYPAGDLIYLDGTTATAAVSIRNLEINAGGPYSGWYNVSSGAAIRLRKSSGTIHVIENIRINDGFTGLHIDGTQQVMVENFNYFQQNMAPATVPVAGILINGVGNSGLPPTSVSIKGGIITTNDPTDADCITAGILIQNVDGLLVDGMHIGGGPQTGIMLQGINGSLIANIYVDHVLLDINRLYGIRAYQASGVAAFFGGMTFSNSHFNGENYIFPANTTVDGIRIETGAGYLIANNVIANFGANGIQLAAAGAIDRVTISGNKIYDNNYFDTAGLSGVSINAPASSQLLIEGNDIQNAAGVGHQKYGVNFLVAASKVGVSGNLLSGNETGTVGFVAVPTEFVLSGNEGWTNNIPAVASGASIAAPAADAFTVTGTTQVTTITGGWAGREVTLIFTNATPGGVGTGGNIARTQAAAQNQSIRLRHNGTNWY